MVIKSFSASFAIVLLLLTGLARAQDAAAPKSYFAHEVVEDRYGVIAPWYRGQNGQCDLRVRIAAETLKRYPWAEPPAAVMPAPHFVFNGRWSIAADGKISINPKLKDWDNGDVGQRSASLLLGFADYYRYTGDPAAIGIVTTTADYVLDYCQTPADHPWPQFFIGAPTKGKAYGRADVHGFIQLDLTAWVGSGMVAAYKLTGEQRYLEAAKHWADVLAEHCDTAAGAGPSWPRYANPKDIPWKDNVQTAGVVFILEFLDDVIHTGYSGKDDALVKAKLAGERYLRETLLPRWTEDPTFGHHFWDWPNAVVTCTLPNEVARYLMDHPDSFPNWKNDVRNIVSLEFCRFGVDPASAGGVYSGAWAFPESSACCGKSLQYPIVLSAGTLARYGAVVDSAWAKEIARRQTILFTYDAHETGVVEDGIDGGTLFTGIWFNLAHPWPMRGVMNLIAWQPETMGANRENHFMRSSSVVRDVRYEKGHVAYTTHDAPEHSVDVLRLAFAPKTISADGKALQLQEKLTGNGYTIQPLSNGDCIVTIRHDGCRSVVVEGGDPQQMADDDRLQYEGAWTVSDSPDAFGSKLHVASARGASASFEFEGNQFRLLGHVDPNGGKLDVYLDGTKQLCGIDFWCPKARDGQVVYYKNGLAQGWHTLRLVARGEKNPRSQGTQVSFDAVQWSAAQGAVGSGEGEGPAEPQRVIFGYTGREDYVDSRGHSWRPATEFVLRLREMADLVPAAFWSEPRIKDVANASDPELYRRGVHGRDFTAYFTVNPQSKYYARIKLCQAAESATPGQYATTIDIQGETVATDVDIPATAGGVGRAADLVFNDIEPRNGVIAIRFRNRQAGEAMVQAIEIGQGNSEPGATPVSFTPPAKK